MKALTLYASWAHAIVHHGKPVENRTWRPPKEIIGQRIAIHAGKTLDKAGLEAIASEWNVQVDPKSVPRSAIVGTAIVWGWLFQGRILGPVRTSLEKENSYRSHDLKELAKSVWFCGPYGWALSDVKALASPIPANGSLGLWQLTPEQERAVLVQQ